MKLLLPFLLLMSGMVCAQSNGTLYTVKGGLTIATQRWNAFDRDPLLTYHGALGIESVSENSPFSLYAQLGYHVKGSAIRRTLFGSPFSAGAVSLPPRKFEFYNISLVLGAKQRFVDVGSSGNAYYIFGIRGDYTIDTNLDQYNTFVEDNNANGSFLITPGTFPFDIYYNGSTLLGVRRINYGLTVGGGVDFPFSEYMQGMIEFSVNPDFSLQYQQPALDNVRNPFNPNQSRNIPERNIRNLTFEVSLGIRFLRKVEYID